MSFLKRKLQEGISKGIGDAIGKAVREAVEPTATELANKAAARIDEAARERRAQEQQEEREVQSSLEGIFGNLKTSMEDYVTEASKNMKICPNCEQPTSADKTFCPNCGTKLPETTVAQGAVCPNCGKQNAVGTKFCSDCGTKLPAAVQEEEAKAAKDQQVLDEWQQKIPHYPLWNGGGYSFNLEYVEGTYYMFVAELESYEQAKEAVKNYRILLQESGFRPAGQYPSVEHLYKMVDGVCYHVDTEHCFDGDLNCVTLGFDESEPTGGFNYVKEEPKKKGGFADLFKF